ncbi:MAG TPA: winged helix-turn-helix domain-containing protein [Pyrinomonadaceae bacterium]
MQTIEAKTRQIYEFDNFRLDVQERQLWRDGEPVALYAKAFEMLVVLVENRGRLLAKDELFALVWSDQIVEESNLTVNMSAVRKALGERASSPRYVKTVSGQGYRFVADVREQSGETNEFVIESEMISRVIIEREESGNESEISNLKFENNKQSSAFRRLRFKIIAAALILAAFGIGIFVTRRSGSQVKNFAPQIASFKRLTENGKVTVAALSRDGKLFAYTVGTRDTNSLWLGHTDGGEQIELRPPTNLIIFSLKFAPGGSSLYYTANEGFGRGGLYRIPVFGGAPEKIRDDVNRAFTFAPDGKRLAFVDYDADKRQSLLVIAETTPDAQRQVIAESPTKFGFIRTSPVWSPDGATIAVAASTREDDSNCEIYTVDTASGVIKPLTAQSWGSILGLVWQNDGSGLIAAARERSSLASSQLWQISFPDGAAQKLLADLSLYGASLSLPADGDNLLAVQVQQQSNVWVAPAGDLGAAKQITFASLGQENGWYGLEWMPDERMIYTKLDEKGVSIWTMNADGGNAKQLIPSGGDNLYPTVTNDGRFVVFQSNRSGTAEIWRAAADGGDMTQLTRGELAGLPALSPDGKWIVYDSRAAESSGLRRMPVEGGASQRLSEKTLNWVGISPDSKLVAAGYEENGKPKLVVISIDGGEFVKTFDVPPLANFRLGIKWTPDGTGITYRDWTNGIWQQPFSGGAPPSRLENLPREKLFDYGWSRDGKRFAFVRGAAFSDVVLISNTK